MRTSRPFELTTNGKRPFSTADISNVGTVQPGTDRAFDASTSASPRPVAGPSSSALRYGSRPGGEGWSAYPSRAGARW